MGSTVYPPFAPAGTLRVREQARRLRDCLGGRHAHSAMDPYWGARFWQDVIMEDNLRGLEAEVRAVLQGHGFLGEATMGAPGATLEKALEELEKKGGPPHGTGASLAAGAAAAWGGMGEGGNTFDEVPWDQRLAADFRRGAVEKNRSLKSQGSSSMRTWLQQNYTGSKEAAVFTDLWGAACAVGYRLAREGNDEGRRNMALATDDALEIHLRRLAAWQYERRTGDRQGAVHMLAVRPPGMSADVAPSWMVEDATAHSKMEYQRGERVRTEERRRDQGDYGGGRGAYQRPGKGGGDAGGRGKGDGPKGRGRGRGRAQH